MQQPDGRTEVANESSASDGVEVDAAEDVAEVD